jgi:hypothetical protein
MKKYFSVLMVTATITLSGCNFHRSCPTYAVEKHKADSAISVDVKQDSNSI